MMVLSVDKNSSSKKESSSSKWNITYNPMLHFIDFVYNEKMKQKKLLITNEFLDNIKLFL